MARITSPTLLAFAARFGIYPSRPNTDGSRQARAALRTMPGATPAKPLRVPEKAPAPNSTQQRGPAVFTQGATHAGRGYVGPSNIRK